MRKKVFNFCLIGALLLSSVLSFTGCKEDYDDDIDDLKKEIASLKTLLDNKLEGKVVKDLSVEGNEINVTYTDGTSTKLTIDDQGVIPEYDLRLNGKTLEFIENGVVKQSFELDFVSEVPGETGDTVSAGDFSIIDGYLAYKGVKTDVYISDAYEPETLTIVLEDGSYYIYSGENKISGFIPEVKIVDGKLYVMGEEYKVDLQLPENTTYVTYILDDQGEILSASISVNGQDIYLPIARPLEGLIFIPGEYVEGVGSARYNVIYRSNAVQMQSYTKLNFRTNPSSADINAVSDWIFLNRAVVFGTRAESDDLMKIIGKPVAGPNSSMQIKTQALYAKSQMDAAENKYDVVNLQAKVDGNDVVSDDVQVLFNLYKDVAIVNKKKTDAAVEVEKYVFPTLETAVKADPAIHFTVETTEFNLNDYVLGDIDLNNAYERPSYGTSTSWDFTELSNLGFEGYSFDFESIEYIPGGTNNTDQAYYVTLDKASGNVKVNGDYAYENRTPIFQADLKNEAGVVIATHYIKFLLKKATTPPATETVTISAERVEVDYVSLYDALNAPELVGPAWQRMSDEVYEVVGLNHDDFVEQYITFGTQELVYDFEADGTYLDDLGSMNISDGTTGTSTAVTTITIDPQTRFGEHVWTVVLTPRDNIYKVVKIEFPFELKVPAHPAPDPSYMIGGLNGTTTVKGTFVGNVYKMQTTLAESFLLSGKDAFQADVIDVIATAGGVQTHEMRFQDLLTTNTVDGIRASISAGNVFDQIISLDNPIQDNPVTYQTVLRSVYENNGVVESKWNVRFINPLDITLGTFELATELEPYTIDCMNKFKLVVVDNYTIYNNGTTNTVDQARFGITTPVWTITNSEVEASKLYLSGTMLTWDNDGSSLGENKTTEKVSVRVETDYAIRTATTDITLLKTGLIPATDN